MAHPLTPETLAELRLLALFDLNSHQRGLKIHSHATPEIIGAAERLFAKGLTSQHDGGYLTDLGYEAARALRDVLDILDAEAEPHGH